MTDMGANRYLPCGFRRNDERREEGSRLTGASG